MGADLVFEEFAIDVPGRGSVRAKGKVASGERVVLHGPSGCGKTTFLKTVAGLRASPSGCVSLGGVELNAVSPQARQLGLVFQGGALFPHLDVLGNVSFGLSFAPTTRDWSEALRREKAREHLSRAGLDSLGSRSVVELSGGERQRVALVRTLVCEPRAILLDEPLSAVDPERRRDLQEWILERVAASGAPMILVTHDREEARRMGTKEIEWPNGSDSLLVF